MWKYTTLLKVGFINKSELENAIAKSNSEYFIKPTHYEQTRSEVKCQVQFTGPDWLKVAPQPCFLNLCPLVH